MSMMIARKILVLVAVAFALNAEAKLVMTAKIFDENSQKQTLLFDFQREMEATEKTLSVTTQFHDPSGALAASEHAEIEKEKPDRVLSYTQEQKQLGAVGSVEVKDGKVYFKYTRDGKTKESSEKAQDNLVVTPTVLAYLQNRWDKIAGGETIKVRLAVLDRLETVGFEYFKEKEVDLDGEKAIVVKMKPSSFIIAALVDPLHFYFSKDGKHLLEIHGRTLLKRNVSGKWKDLDAVTVYKYVSAE